MVPHDFQEVLKLNINGPKQKRSNMELNFGEA